MPNYFAVNLTSHTWLLQPALTLYKLMVILPFKEVSTISGLWTGLDFRLDYGLTAL